MNIYSPFASVIVEYAVFTNGPVASPVQRFTVTPATPGSLGSWIPFLLISSQTLLPTAASL